MSAYALRREAEAGAQRSARPGQRGPARDRAAPAPGPKGRGTRAEPRRAVQRVGSAPALRSRGCGGPGSLEVSGGRDPLQDAPSLPRAQPWLSCSSGERAPPVWGGRGSWGRRGGWPLSRLAPAPQLRAAPPSPSLPPPPEPSRGQNIPGERGDQALAPLGPSPHPQRRSGEGAGVSVRVRAASAWARLALFSLGVHIPSLATWPLCELGPARLPLCAWSPRLNNGDDSADPTEN